MSAKKNNQQNILITGAGGFVGSHLAEAELKDGNKVVGVDLANDGKVKEFLDNEDFTYLQKDMLNKELMEYLVKDSDLVYHFGAIANVQTYCADPLRVLNTNIDSLKLMLELCHKHKKKIAFSSSSEVYGMNPKVPWSEDDQRVLGSTRNHRWCYSTSKSIGEHYCFAYAKDGLDTVIYRFFNFYGPKLDFLGKGRVITCFLEKFLNDRPVEVVEPGDQTRCFTYISDGIEAVKRAAHMDAANGQVFNIGTNDEISMLDLAQKMKDVGKFKNKIVMVKPSKIYGEGYEDIFRRIPNIDKQEKVLGYKPQVSLKEGLEKTINYFRDLKNA